MMEKGSDGRSARLKSLLRALEGKEKRALLADLLSTALPADCQDFQLISPIESGELYAQIIDSVQQEYEKGMPEVELNTRSDVEAWINAQVRKLDASRRFVVILGHSETLGVIECDREVVRNMLGTLLDFDGECVFFVAQDGLSGIALDLEIAEDGWLVRAASWPWLLDVAVHEVVGG